MTRPLALAAPRVSETAEAAALWQWRDVLVPRYPVMRLMVHCPNEGRRGPHVARLSGIVAGVPDVLVLAPAAQLVAGHPVHGLALELKARGGRVTEAQAAFLDQLRAAGWDADVVWLAAPGDWAIAARRIAGHLGLPPEVWP